MHTNYSDLLQAIAIKHIEEMLIQNIKRECQCNFNPDQFQNSTINCESSSELVYMTTLEYSNDEGSETASIIAERIVRQVPFSMAVGGTQLTVTSACTDCDIITTKPVSDQQSLVLSPALGGGLFIGGFAAAIFIAVTLMILVYVYHNLTNSMQIYYFVFTGFWQRRSVPSLMVKVKVLLK